jgi:hypothetical protein
MVEMPASGALAEESAGREEIDDALNGPGRYNDGSTSASGVPRGRPDVHWTRP